MYGMPSMIQKITMIWTLTTDPMKVVETIKPMSIEVQVNQRVKLRTRELRNLLS